MKTVNIVNTKGEVVFTYEPTGGERRTISMDAHAINKMGVHPKSLEGVDFRNLDMNGMDLRNKSLLGCDLRGVDLKNVLLRDVSFFGASTAGMLLQGADLNGVSLFGVNLTELDLRGVCLGNANLHKVSFYNVDLKGCSLIGVDPRTVNLRGALNPPLVLTGLICPVSIDGFGNITIGLNTYTVDKLREDPKYPHPENTRDVLAQQKDLLISLCENYRHDK